MKIGDRIFVRGYIDEIRKDTVIVRNDGGYFGTIPSEVTRELPSAQPERKKGKWIGKYPVTSACSECDYLIHDSKVKVFAYCPNCGADMRGEQDDER